MTQNWAGGERNGVFEKITKGDRKRTLGFGEKNGMEESRKLEGAMCDRREIAGV